MIFAGSALGWYIIGGAALVALLCAVAGLALIGREALRLKKRIETYGDLPVRATIERALAQIERSSRGIEAFPDLVDRATRALDDLSAAKAKVGASIGTIRAIFNLWPARPSRGARIPES